MIIYYLNRLFHPKVIFTGQLFKTRFRPVFWLKVCFQTSDYFKIFTSYLKKASIDSDRISADLSLNS